MKRIGFAASKMAKGNLALYNFYVILISILFSLFVFVVAGATIVFALVILTYVGEEVMIFPHKKDWFTILTVCLVSLTIVTSAFTGMAVLKNFKFSKKKTNH